MTFVVTENCIKCKYTDCVEVCPVDCFYEGENMLVIHPDECIDCGVCVPRVSRQRDLFGCRAAGHGELAPPQSAVLGKLAQYRRKRPPLRGCRPREWP